MVKDDPPRKVTAGGARLKEFLLTTKTSITKFCLAHRLDRIQVQRVINGERWQRVSVDLAMALSDATGGVVPVDSFHSRTAKTTKVKRSRAA